MSMSIERLRARVSRDNQLDEQRLRAFIEAMEKVKASAEQMREALAALAGPMNEITEALKRKP